MVEGFSPADFNKLPSYILSVGALGTAAYGLVESVGKTLFLGTWFGRRIGLPYAGYGKVHALVKVLKPALLIAYGKDFEQLLWQQYRAARAAGDAPTMLRQGVRLALPFMAQDAATDIVKAIGGLDEQRVTTFVTALLKEKTSGSEDLSEDEISDGQALAGRFATVLDARVKAAFDAAEEIYQSQVRSWAALAALTCSLGYWAFEAQGTMSQLFIYVAAGLIAAPLAPVAKDIASSLSDSTAALGSLIPRRK
ncbi:MAG: hypothetical protein CGW95_08670 [Phenylobacterium zucineum]|nr:MAG: hypothetical protein CGW95_08670 [Phenylobacterium zucineum]